MIVISKVWISSNAKAISYNIDSIRITPPGYLISDKMRMYGLTDSSYIRIVFVYWYYVIVHARVTMATRTATSGVEVDWAILCTRIIRQWFTVGVDSVTAKLSISKPNIALYRTYTKFIITLSLLILEQFILS